MKKNESTTAAKASCTPTCKDCDQCRVVSYQTLPGHNKEGRGNDKSLYNTEVVLYEFYFLSARVANYAV